MQSRKVYIVELHLISTVNNALTQWLVQSPTTTAAPKLRAGFMLAPVKATPAKCPTDTAKPIARPAIGLLSGLFGSQTPKTVKTNMKPKKNSTPKPCSGEIWELTAVLPKPASCSKSGVRPWK